jgi:hypothetical protein
VNGKPLLFSRQFRGLDTAKLLQLLHRDIANNGFLNGQANESVS